MQQTWIWTALPNGVIDHPKQGPCLQVSLIVSPRLHVNYLTEEWRRWPLTVDKQLQFSIVLAEDINGAPGATQYTWSEFAQSPQLILHRDRRRADDDDRFETAEAARAWRVMFNRNALAGLRGGVAVKRVPEANAVLCDLPVLETKAIRQADTADEVKQRYAAGPIRCDIPAASSTSRAPDNAKLGATAVICDLPEKATRCELPGDTETASAQTVQLATERLEPVETVKIGIGKTAEQVREFDFHQRISALADYPALLEMFRIVVKVLLPLKIQPADGGKKQWIALPKDGWIWPVIRSKDALPEVRCVSTRAACHFDQAEEIDDQGAHRPGAVKRFLMREDVANKMRYGSPLANARESRFQLQSVDSVSAAIKLQSMQRAAPGTTPELPALRTTGFTFLVKQATDDVQTAMKRQVELDTAMDRSMRGLKTGMQANTDATLPQPADLPAVWLDHVVVGNRISVVRWASADAKPEKELSLCRRSGRYSFADAKRRPIDKLIDEGIVSDTHARRGGKTVINDALATWAGWGLCIPRPGFQQDLSRRILDQHNRLANTERLPLDVQFSPEPESLPMLRFGSYYRFWVHPVDLAGNTMAVPEDACPCKCGCGKPANGCDKGLVRFGRLDPIPAPLVMGGSDRSFAESAREMVLYSLESSADEFTFLKELHTDGVERWLFPPATPPRLAEWHGAFDGYSAKKVYQLLCDRVEVPPDWKDTKPPTQPSARDREKRKTPPEFDDTLSYLPDPLAYRVSAELLIDEGDGPSRLLPSRTHRFFLRDGDQDYRDGLPGAWQKWTPLRIRLVTWAPTPDETANATADGVCFDLKEKEDGSTLTIKLVPGRSAKLRLRCQPKSSDVQAFFETHRWLGKSDEDLKMILESGGSLLDLIAPPIHVTLTHAVQKSGKVAVQIQEVPRALGVAAVTLKAMPRRDAATPLLTASPLTVDTDGVEVTAEIEQVDDELSMDWRHDGPIPKRVFQQLRLPSLSALSEMTLNLPSAAAYRVILSARSTSRYRGLILKREIEEQLKPEEPFITTRDAAVIDVARKAAAGASIEYWAPNAKPPLAPEIAYVVPIVLPVRENALPGGRRRYGFRVYLRRPWFVSGADERLAVICRPERAKEQSPKEYRTILESRLRGLVTEWGADPIRDTLTHEFGSAVKVAPTLADFQLPTNCNDDQPSASLVRDFQPLELRANVRPLPLDRVPQFQRKAIPCDIPGRAVICDVPPKPVLCDVNLARPICDVPAAAARAIACDIPSKTEKTAVICDLPGQPSTVDFVAFPVYQSPMSHGSERLCYADVIFETDALNGQYFPFIRLALARYQPRSITPPDDRYGGVHLSSIVLADFMLLAAERMLQVRPSKSAPGKISLRLTGPGVKVIPGDVNNGSPDKSRGILPSQLHVTVERRVHTRGGTEAWIVESDAPVALYSEADQGYTVDVALKDSQAVYRVVLREYEVYLDANHQPARRCILIATRPIGDPGTDR